MSAQELRQAAALMRQRAEAAGRCGVSAGCTDPAHVWYRIGELRERFSDVRTVDSDAEHIASWHPAVAVLVADWLVSEAEAIEFMQAADPEYTIRPNDEGLLVARAYLGSGS